MTIPNKTELEIGPEQESEYLLMHFLMAAVQKLGGKLILTEEMLDQTDGKIIRMTMPDDNQVILEVKDDEEA